MRASSIAVLVAAAGVLVASDAVRAQVSQERTLKLSFDTEGLVTLRAQNVTPREVLAEWKRLCQCAVVDAEKLTGGPIVMPLAFEKASQAVVLETLLRQAAGLILTPRRVDASGPSNYETIYVLATSNPVASPSYSSYPSPVSAPPFQSNISTPGSPADEIPPVSPIPGQGLQVQPPANNQNRSPATPYSPGVINAPGAGSTAPGAGAATPGPVFVPITPIGGSSTPRPGGGLPGVPPGGSAGSGS